MFKKIVLIMGMPRSGTSWLGQIFDSSPQVAFRLSPLFSYALKNRVNETSSQAEFEEMFRLAYQADEDEFMNQSNRRQAGHYPTFKEKRDLLDYLVIKDTRYHHLLPRMLELVENLQVIAIVRHPCGAIYSWITHPKEFPPTADPLQEWRTGACRKTGPEEFWGFEDWKKVTRVHLQLEQSYPSRFCIVQYEHLAQNPIPLTRQMFDFVGLDYVRQTEAFLISSQQTEDPDPYAVYKTPDVKDRWREALAPHIQAEIIQEIQSTELARFLV